MQQTNKTPVITIFGSSHPVSGEPAYQTAYLIGKLTAQSGFIVCNGGYGGIMEASASGAKDAGGKTIGVVTKFFDKEINRYIDQKIIANTLIERLQKLIELGDAYVVLAGGTGTLLEFSAVWEYMNKKVIDVKPFIVVGDFWLSLVKQFQNELTHEGLHEAAKFVTIVSTPQECVDALKEKLQAKPSR
jgi:uncharacterized protein (TIGR00730 family)